MATLGGGGGGGPGLVLSRQTPKGNLRLLHGTPTNLKIYESSQHPSNELNGRRGGALHQPANRTINPPIDGAAQLNRRTESQPGARVSCPMIAVPKLYITDIIINPQKGEDMSLDRHSFGDGAARQKAVPALRPLPVDEGPLGINDPREPTVIRIT